MPAPLSIRPFKVSARHLNRLSTQWHELKAATDPHAVLAALFLLHCVAKEIEESLPGEEKKPESP